MPNSDAWKDAAGLALLGAAIAIGRAMTEREWCGLRRSAGRVIVGSGLSISAGAALSIFPDLQPLAVIGIGAAFGISGQQALEAMSYRILHARLGLNLDPGRDVQKDGEK